MVGDRPRHRAGRGRSSGVIGRMTNPGPGAGLGVGRRWFIAVIVSLVPSPPRTTAAAGEPPATPSLFGDPRELPTRRASVDLRGADPGGRRQEERNRLARDLHDSIKQQIFAIQTAAATAQARFASDPSGARGAVEQVRDSAREAMAEMEVDARPAPGRAPREHRPRRSAEEAMRGAAVPHRRRCPSSTLGDLPPDEAFPPGAQEVVFRIAPGGPGQRRPSRPRDPRHGCRSTPPRVSLQLRVDDDGVGFEPRRAAVRHGTRQHAVAGRGHRRNGRRHDEPGKGTLVRAVRSARPRRQWTSGVYRRRRLLGRGAALLDLRRRRLGSSCRRSAGRSSIVCRSSSFTCG